MLMHSPRLFLSMTMLPLSLWLSGCSQPANQASLEETATESSQPAAPATRDVSNHDSTVTPVTEPNSAPSENQNLVEGRDYTVIKAPLPLEKPDQIEVREFFWYGCSHCYSLEPHLKNWLATKPTDVNFIRTPAALNPVWEQNARAYYAVEGMGKMTDQLHDQLFQTIHQKQQTVFDQPSLAKFYTQAGVDAAQFDSAYNSFAVSTKINQSKKMAQQAGLSGVPALVVNGKYLVGGEPQQVIQTVNGLIQQERQALASSTR